MPAAKPQTTISFKTGIEYKIQTMDAHFYSLITYQNDLKALSDFRRKILHKHLYEVNFTGIVFM
jgi:transcription termination factor NusB